MTSSSASGSSRPRASHRASATRGAQRPYPSWSVTSSEGRTSIPTRPECALTPRAAPRSVPRSSILRANLQNDGRLAGAWLAPVRLLRELGRAPHSTPRRVSVVSRGPTGRSRIVSKVYPEAPCPLPPAPGDRRATCRRSFRRSRRVTRRRWRRSSERYTTTTSSSSRGLRGRRTPRCTSPQRRARCRSSSCSSPCTRSTRSGRGRT